MNQTSSSYEADSNGTFHFFVHVFNWIEAVLSVLGVICSVLQIHILADRDLRKKSLYFILLLIAVATFFQMVENIVYLSVQMGSSVEFFEFPAGYFIYSSAQSIVNWLIATLSILQVRYALCLGTALSNFSLKKSYMLTAFIIITLLIVNSPTLICRKLPAIPGKADLVITTWIKEKDSLCTKSVINIFKILTRGCPAIVLIIMSLVLSSFITKSRKERTKRNISIDDSASNKKYTSNSKMLIFIAVVNTFGNGLYSIAFTIRLLFELNDLFYWNYFYIVSRTIGPISGITYLIITSKMSIEIERVIKTKYNHFRAAVRQISHTANSLMRKPKNQDEIKKCSFLSSM